MNLIFWAVLVIIVIVIFGILIAWLVTRNKSRGGHQDQILMQEDNALTENRLAVFLGFMTDKEKKEIKGEMVNAYGIDNSNQVYDRTLGGYIQVNSERDVNPVQLFGDEPTRVTKAIMQGMAHQVTEDAINYAMNKHINPTTLNRLTWVLILEVIALIAMVGMKAHLAGAF